LLQKPISPIETYNDLNGDVVNFFRMLRERCTELCESIRWTPWARDEWEASKSRDCDDLERARRWWVYHAMTISAASNQSSSGWRIDSQAVRRPAEKSQRDDVIANLHRVAARLASVQIENRDMNNVIMRMDGRGTLFYLDPPYVLDTRSKKSMYGVEWSDSDHAKFIEMAQNLQGFCIISGYACELYEPLERAGWHREDKKVVNNSGGTRTESLWLCPRTVEASIGVLF
jgi:DNA adenine methylase